MVGEVELRAGAGAAVGEGVQGGGVLVQQGVRAGAGELSGGSGGDVRAGDPSGGGGRAVRAGQPAAAALEGVRRQRDAPALLALEPGRPVDVHSRLPGAGHRIPGSVGHAEGDTAHLVVCAAHRDARTTGGPHLALTGQRVRERQRAGDTGGEPGREPVTVHRDRRDAPAQPHPAERVLHGERPPPLAQLPGTGRECGLVVPGEGGLVGAPLLGQPRRVRDVLGEDERHLTGAGPLGNRGLAQGPGEGGAVGSGDGEAVLVGAAAHGQRVGDVGQGAWVVALKVVVEVAGQVPGGRGQRGRRTGGHHQHLRRARGPGDRGGRSLLEDGVRVGAADAEGADARAQRPLRRPGHGVRADLEGARREVDGRVGRLVVDGRHQRPVPHHQRRLDHTRDTGRRVQVADVGLHRADGAEPGVAGGLPERPGERRYLDRVAEPGGGAVRLDVPDGARVDAGDGVRLADDGGLPGGAGRGEADLPGAVVVGRRALDDGVDGVPVGDRVLQELQDDHAHAVAEHGAAGVGVEGAHVPVLGQDRALLVQVPLRLRQFDGDTARQRHVALAVDQALAGQVDGDEGGGTGGLDGVARSLEVELVRQPGGQEVLVVADHHREVAGGGGLVDVGQDLLLEVGVDRRSGVDADQPVVAARVVTGVLQRGVACRQQDPVLRVGDRGLGRSELEVPGVEQVHVRDDPVGRHVARVVQQPLGHPRRRQFLAAEAGDALAALSQQAPEGVQVVGTGETPGHTDDRDIRLGGLDLVAAHWPDLSLSCARCACPGADGRAVALVRVRALGPCVLRR
ncbi:hypothetical protein SNL152K_783 [Streptomyces sp. NL15-2K]|nr:hypothetical protein SNL152K_783 [Streptomyces sp. NL15-2K]